ncbi:hypothetical protein SLE2022_024580 [Rubroshorea leprosula]
MFGKFVSLDGSTIKKSRLDVAKVLILTPLQENINKTLKIKVRNQFFQVRISEEVGVDNIFILRSDFNLCRNDDSTSESWSEGSNWGVVDEEESWDDWKVVVEKAGTKKNNSVEPGQPAEHTPEEEEFEKVSETLEQSEGTINARRQISNQQKVESLEENGVTVQWITEPNLKRKQNQQMTEEVKENTSYVGSCPPGFSPKNRKLSPLIPKGPIGQSENNHTRELHEERTQIQTDDLMKEKEVPGEGNLVREHDSKRGDTNHKAKLVLLQSGKINNDETIEEERRTQPFWEGLASDDEILQSRVERFAQQRKREKKKVRVRKLAARKKAQLKIHSDLKGKNKKSINEEESQAGGCPTKANRKVEHNWGKEAEEIWRIRKQLGLAEKSNEGEIMEKLCDMERRDIIALAKQRVTEAEKKGVKPVN